MNENNLVCDQELQNEFKKRYSAFYLNLTVVDLYTKFPVEYTLNFKLNSSYDLRSYFSQEDINKFEIHNEDNTLAYCPGGLAAFKIDLTNLGHLLNSERVVFKDLLLNIFYYEAYLTRYETNINELYNLAIYVNQNHFHNEHDEIELKTIVNQLWKNYVDYELHPVITSRRSVINKAFYAKYNSLELLKKGKPYFIVREINRLVGMKKKELFNTHLKEAGEELRKGNIRCTPTTIAKKLVSSYPELYPNKRSIQNQLYKKGAKIHTPYKEVFNMQDVQNCTFSNLRDGIFCTFHNLLAGNEPIKAQLIADVAGVSLRSVKDYYPEMKQQIKEHKHKIKSMITKPEKFTS